MTQLQPTSVSLRSPSLRVSSPKVLVARSWSSQSSARFDGWPIWLSEVITTIGLLLVIHAAVRHGKPYVVAPESAPMFIAMQIIGALIAFALIKPLVHNYRND